MKLLGLVDEVSRPRRPGIGRESGRRGEVRFVEGERTRQVVEYKDDCCTAPSAAKSTQTS